MLYEVKNSKQTLPNMEFLQSIIMKYHQIELKDINFNAWIIGRYAYKVDLHFL